MASQVLIPPPMLPSSSRNGFFKTLPRELRDNIYDLLHRKIEHEHRAYYIRFSITLLAIRLTCRQLKREYDERCAANEHIGRLLVDDSAARLSRSYSWAQIPALADHTINMTIILKACTGVHWGNEDDGCGHSNLASFHGDWIHRLATRMICLRWIHVYLAVPKDSCVNTTLMSLDHITGNPQVMRLEVLRPGFEFLEGGNNHSVLATWTRENELKQDDEAVKQCSERARMKL